MIRVVSSFQGRIYTEVCGTFNKRAMIRVVSSFQGRIRTEVCGKFYKRADTSSFEVGQLKCTVGL